MSRRRLSCEEAEAQTRAAVRVIGGHHNYMRGNPEFSDPCAPAETVTIWETVAGDWLTNTLDADGCRHYIEAAPDDGDDS